MAHSIPSLDPTFNYQLVRDHSIWCLDNMLDGVRGRAAAMGTFLTDAAREGYERRADQCRHTIVLCEENIRQLANQR